MNTTLDSIAPDVAQAVIAQAAALGLSANDYLRRLLGLTNYTDAEWRTTMPVGESDTSLEPTEFRLSAEQWEAFCARLDEPAKSIPALRELFSEPE